ncbi:conserved hypothetical protein [Capnocytophaga canimorsus]|nr:conserved hypothetical protein [Capnocytophaga canimorsus]
MVIWKYSILKYAKIRHLLTSSSSYFRNRMKKMDLLSPIYSFFAQFFISKNKNNPLTDRGLFFEVVTNHKVTEN